jgi:hypothetical protein
MKKFMFSAVAMIAFVGSSMANTTVEENCTVRISSEILVENQIEALLVADNCDVAKFSAYADARCSDLTHEEATAHSWTIYFLCMSQNNAKRKAPSLEPS